MIVTPQFLVMGAIGALDALVIGGVGGVVAPAVIGCKGLNRKPCFWGRQTVRPVENPAQGENSGRGCSVSFLFVGPNSVLAEGTTHPLTVPSQMAGRQDGDFHGGSIPCPWPFA